MPAVQDIFIDQLRLRASSREAQLITNDLENSSWSVNANHEWIFIREISVRSGINRIRQSASQEVDNHISQAVDGRFGHAENANAVFFRSLPELLAFLLRDLVRNEALKKWYWKKWAYLLAEPGSQAVNRLLWEYSEYLPALVEELVVINRLPEVWKCLSENSAALIINKLLRSTSSHALGEEALSKADHVKNRENIKLLQRVFFAHGNNMRAWSNALISLQHTDKRYQLAAVIASIHYCPLIIETNIYSAIQGFTAFIENLKEGIVTEPKQVSSFMRGSGDGVVKFNPEKIDQKGIAEQTANGMQEFFEANTYIDGISKDNNSDLEHLSQPLLSNSNSKNINGLRDKPKKELDAGSAQLQVSSNRADLSLNETTTRNDIISGNAFTSVAGGLFYLINALNNEQIYQLLLQNPRMDDSVNGWIWLFDMTRRLDAELDQSMLQFIAEQCAYDSVDMLLEISPLAELDKVEVGLASRYHKEDFWNASLIEVAAHIVTSASHIDVYFSLDSVRLSVRLAGLDVNPGWVPWLGRVVTFNYRDSLPGGQSHGR